MVITFLYSCTLMRLNKMLSLIWIKTVLKVNRCLIQWRQNTEKVTHIKKRLLDQVIIPFLKWEILLKERICSQREQILSFKSSSLKYGNHFNHIKWPPLNVTIFITHVRNLRNRCYTNVINGLASRKPEFAACECLMVKPFSNGLDPDLTWQNAWKCLAWLIACLFFSIFS